MVKVQLDIDKKLNKNIKLYSVKNDLNDKRLAIIDILEKRFKE